MNYDDYSYKLRFIIIGTYDFEAVWFVGFQLWLILVRKLICSGPHQCLEDPQDPKKHFFLGIYENYLT